MRPEASPRFPTSSSSTASSSGMPPLYTRHAVQCQSARSSDRRRGPWLCELLRTPLPRRWLNKGKEKGWGTTTRPFERDGCNTQLAVVATFLHVPGVPEAVHTHSVAAESMEISPLA